jgi:hypothetical protein
MDDHGALEFKALRIGLRPLVKVDAGGITAQTGRWTTKGTRATTIPRSSITGVEVRTVVARPTDSLLLRKAVLPNGQVALLKVTSLTDQLELRTEVAVAEKAREILLAPQ